MAGRPSGRAEGLGPTWRSTAGGYSAVCWAVGGGAIAFLLWECATPILGPRLGWSWCYGDLVDLVAGVLGVVLGAGAFLVARSSRRP